MGNYNPYIPYILGQEWAPIRDEDVVFSPAVNVEEVGHGFTLSASRTLQDARFYANTLPGSFGLGQVYMVNIYPQGTEALSGPISRVIIPVNNGGITGTGGSISFANSSSVAEALLDPSDTKYIASNSLLPNGGGDISMFFAINQYIQLNSKRILAINFLYSTLAAGTNGLPLTYMSSSLRLDDGTGVSFGPLDIGVGVVGRNSPVLTKGLGEVNHFYNAPPIGSIRVPFTYTQLRRLEASATNRIHLHLNLQGESTTQSTWYLYYGALEVFYCEENRVAVAGAAFGPDYSSSSQRPYVDGVNILPARDLSGNINPVLAPGNYLATLSSPNIGDLFSSLFGINSNIGVAVSDTPYPTLNGLRELYPLPSHPSLKVKIPFPMDERAIGSTFSEEYTAILPQISLHTSGGPLTEVHVYGRQVAAPVYGAVKPEQEIYDDALSGATVYDQVRFYARRFGDTTVPLEVFGIGGTTGSASIKPEEFDALDEITTSGWKAVTLTMTTSSTMGTLAPPNPRFRFGANGELAGSRWEVLGASAPALSGVPGNLYNLVPTPNQLYEATYQPPGGSQAELSWLPQGISSPPVTAISDDDGSDVVLMFAQSMPTITGFTVASATQTLVGIGLDCGINPCCVPSALLYNRITWPLPVNTGVASDTFTRTVAAGGWGTAEDGKTWTILGTAGNFSVDGTKGVISPSATGTQQIATVPIAGPDQDVQALIRINGTSEGTGSLRAGVVARLTDANNFYTAELWYTQTATAELHIRKVVGGVNTDVATMTLATITPNTVAYRNIRFQVRGQYLMAKIWGENSDEPDWMLSATDTSLTTGNNAGAYARDDTTAAAPNSIFFDSFSVNPPDYWFGSYELQRMDTIDTTWQTIMRATTPATTGFSDFEARVGILTSYRIRGVDVYDFAGPWSSTVTITTPSPGASGGCISQGHVLLFSTNERQAGTSNLAYSSVWEGQVQEDFAFPEASFVQLQAMYNKDFFTAFRPTERGGEQFQRTVLVQAAAISAPTLADFTSLRDMAWEDVSYICVRDEGGNRWFSTVLVPSGRVTHSRKLYMAPVQVIEVTDTPSEADGVS